MISCLKETSSSSESISETIAALTSELVLNIVGGCFETCCISQKPRLMKQTRGAQSMHPEKMAL